MVLRMSKLCVQKLSLQIYILQSIRNKKTKTRFVCVVTIRDWSVQVYSIAVRRNDRAPGESGRLDGANAAPPAQQLGQGENLLPEKHLFV